MKTFIIKTIGFIPCSIIFYIVLVVLWGEIVPSEFNNNIKYVQGFYGHLNTRIREVPQHKDINILFLGNSLCYRGFDPRVFSTYGISTFNLGSSGQTPIQTEVLIKRYISELNPKLVVYVAPEFYGDGVESALDLIANDPSRDQFLLDLVFTINNLKVYNTAFYGYYRTFFNRDKNFSEPRTRKKDTYVFGGFVEREVEYYKPAQEIPKNEETKKIIPSIDYQVNAFKNTVEVLNQNNIPVLFINPPVTPEKNNQRYIDENLINKYGEYIDYNKTIPVNYRWFYDTHHLNQYGVVEFNKLVINHILENKLL